MAEVSLSVLAKNLGMSRQALHKHIRQGHITKVKKVGSFYIVDEDSARAELEEYLSRPNQNYKGRRKHKEAPQEQTPEPKSDDKDEIAASEQK